MNRPDSAHMHDNTVEQPKLYDENDGKRLSDLVIVFTDEGVPRFAQYGDDGFYHGEGDETFGNVVKWYDGYPIPNGYLIDLSRFGGEI